jgi:hypothetical protein
MVYRGLGQDPAILPLHKNPNFLPVKSASTSVVTVLQQVHNLDTRNLRTVGAQFMYPEQRANYILDSHLPIATSNSRRQHAVAERRAKPRSSQALPARVWGVDIHDQPFSFDCHLDNMSASGFYLRLPRQMKFSSVVSVVVRLLYGPLAGMSAAIKGTVIRDESKPDGHRGVGIRIIEHRFI